MYQAVQWGVMSIPNEIVVKATTPPLPRLRALRQGVLLFHAVSLLAGVLALVFLALAFQFLASGVAIALGYRLGAHPAIPLTLATVGSWSLMYLLHDRLGILGSATARTRLRPLAEALADTSVRAWHFVELRPQPRVRGLKSDWGWLLFFEDRLEFVGEHQQITFPRRSIPLAPKQESNLGGLLPTWLLLALHGPLKGISLLCRDTANSLSATAIDAEALRVSLVGWLDSTPLEGYNESAP